MYVLKTHIFSPQNQLQQSLWHFRMSLLKACPATRCSYKCLSILIGFMCQGSRFMKWNYVSARKSSCGTVSHRRCIFVMKNVLELFLRAKKESRGKPSRTWSMHVCVVCVGCTCKPYTHTHTHMLAHLRVRIAPGLISHVCDTGQLAVWHRKQLAELVDYLPKWRVVETKW